MTIWLVVFKVAYVDISITKGIFAKSVHLVDIPLSFVGFSICGLKSAYAVPLVIDYFAFVIAATISINFSVIYTRLGSILSKFKGLSEVLLHQLRLPIQ